MLVTQDSKKLDIKYLSMDLSTAKMHEEAQRHELLVHSGLFVQLGQLLLL